MITLSPGHPLWEAAVALNANKLNAYEGETLGNAAVAPPPSSLSCVGFNTVTAQRSLLADLAHLEETLVDTHALLSELANKLTPILRPELPTEQVATKKGISHCAPVGDQVMNILEGLRSVQERIADLRNRAEI